MISHSEGQGYGMLLAVAARDRASFERIWNWTRANLMVRDDQLIAWRWEPNARPAVADMNNATDGDILIAWALAEAAEFWVDVSYQVAARRIAVEVGRKIIVNKTRFRADAAARHRGLRRRGSQRRPGASISRYWVFPAFSRLLAGRAGIQLVRPDAVGPRPARRHRASATRGLPTEWISAAAPRCGPPTALPAQFSYNAIRIPLYMAWAGVGGREHYAPFAALWSGRERGLCRQSKPRPARKAHRWPRPATPRSRRSRFAPPTARRCRANSTRPRRMKTTIRQRCI